MPAPFIEIRDENDVVVTGFLNLGTLIPGAPSAVNTRSVWNGFGLTGGAAVDTVQNLVMVAQARLTAVGGQWLGDGIGLLESLAIQVQFPDIAEFAGWTNIGSGVPVSLPDLPTDSKHTMLIRALLPAGAPEDAVQFNITYDSVRTVALPGGIYAHEPGISRGVGRGLGAAVLSRSGVFTVSGTDATSTLRWPDYAWYILGRPYQVLGGATSGDEVIDNLDGSAVALAAGETYGFYAVLDATGRSLLKGDKITGTVVYPDDFPPIPADSIIAGWGIRFADADVLAPQFAELVDATPKFFDVTTAALNYTVAPVGVDAIVHGRLNTNKTENSGTFPGDGVHTVWVLPDGSVGDTVGPDALPPLAGSLRLADITIAGGVETARVDYKRWRDTSIAIPWTWGAPVLGIIQQRWRHSGPERLLIRPESVVLQLENTAGGTVIADVLLHPEGGAATTIFTSQGSDDRRPTVAGGAGSATNAGLPEVLVIEPGSLVIAEIDQAAAATAGATLSMIVDVE